METSLHSIDEERWRSFRKGQHLGYRQPKRVTAKQFRETFVRMYGHEPGQDPYDYLPAGGFVEYSDMTAHESGAEGNVEGVARG